MHFCLYATASGFVTMYRMSRKDLKNFHRIILHGETRKRRCTGHCSWHEEPHEEAYIHESKAGTHLLLIRVGYSF